MAPLAEVTEGHREPKVREKEVDGGVVIGAVGTSGLLGLDELGVLRVDRLAVVGDVVEVESDIDRVSGDVRSSLLAERAGHRALGPPKVEMFEQASGVTVGCSAARVRSGSCDGRALGGGPEHEIGEVATGSHGERVRQGGEEDGAKPPVCLTTHVAVGEEPTASTGPMRRWVFLSVTNSPDCGLTTAAAAILVHTDSSAVSLSSTPGSIGIPKDQGISSGGGWPSTGFRNSRPGAFATTTPRTVLERIVHCRNRCLAQESDTDAMDQTTVRERLLREHGRFFQEHNDLYQHAVQAVFDRVQLNVDADVVWVKCSILDTLYFAGLRQMGRSARRGTAVDPYEVMANHIVGLTQQHNLDMLLTQGDPHAVDLIRHGHGLPHGETERDALTFATKFCQFQNPKAYPIYDSRATAALCRIAEVHDFGVPVDSDTLKDYRVLLRVEDWCRRLAGWTDDYREIDHALYMWGDGPW